MSEGITIPPRTSTIYGPLLEVVEKGLAEGFPQEVPHLPQWQCIDCGFATADVDVMLDHQEHQEKYHSWIQQTRRWWALRRWRRRRG